MRVHISGDRKARVSISSARSVQSDDGESAQYVPDSEEEAAMLLGGGDDDSFEGTPEPSKRVTRSKQSKLPFSPKKTRSQRITVVDSESEVDTSRPTRRSTRKTTVKIQIDSDYEDEDDDGDDFSMYSASTSAKAKGKRPMIPKVPIPSYGHIHNVKDINGDPYPDDPDHVALRKHRSVCEKCTEGPAHVLLENYRRRKGKKRKRSSEDEFEMSDGEKYETMGGWVRWCVDLEYFLRTPTHSLTVSNALFPSIGNV